MAIGGLTWITLPPTSFSLYSAATEWVVFFFFVAMNCSAPSTHAFTLYLSGLFTESHQQSQNCVCQELLLTNLAQIRPSACFRGRILVRKKQQLVDAAVLISYIAPKSTVTVYDVARG